LAFAGGNVTSGGVFALFWQPLSGPFSSSFFSETRQKSVSLEPLNGFLAYL